MKTIKTFEAFSAGINESADLAKDEIMNMLQGMETESLISLGDDLIGLEEAQDDEPSEGEEWEETKNDLTRDEILDWISDKYERVGITEADLMDVIRTY